MPSEAKKRATAKWNAANRTTIGLSVNVKKSDQYKDAAARAGTTVSAVMRKALDDLLEEYPDNTGDPSNKKPSE